MRDRRTGDWAMLHLPLYTERIRCVGQLMNRILFRSTSSVVESTKALDRLQQSRAVETRITGCQGSVYMVASSMTHVQVLSRFTVRTEFTRFGWLQNRHRLKL